MHGPFAAELASRTHGSFLRTTAFAFVRDRTIFVAASMFANLFQLITGRGPTPEIERHAFVEEVRVHRDEPRSQKVEILMLVCWVLIAIKHVLIIWVCRQYPVPFHQLWVNFPTWLLGALATAIYYGKSRRK
jgi:hypothetical protein